MIIEDFLEKIENISTDNIILYFITRVLKPNVKKSSKVMDKYLFETYQIDVDDEIREHLHTLTKEQLKSFIKQKGELQEYDVITEDTNQLFTYQMVNKAMSFYDVVNNQLSSNPPKIKCLEEIIVNEELWAYCVGFYEDVTEWIYTFRKIVPSKVAIDESDSNKKTKFQKAIRTIFNSKSQKLELIEGETVNLDKQVDCIYYDNTFYIARKTQFEQIIGLEEEYKQQANEVVSELNSTKMFEGLDVISKEINENPSIHKKMVKLSKIGNYRDLNAKTISKMQKICKKYGEKLKLKDGKILIEEKSDITLVLKVLADYYKLGEISGKSYGTYGGKQLKQV